MPEDCSRKPAPTLPRHTCTSHGRAALVPARYDGVFRRRRLIVRPDKTNAPRLIYHALTRQRVPRVCVRAHLPVRWLSVNLYVDFSCYIVN